jgi:hypothetical protein
LTHQEGFTPEMRIFLPFDVASNKFLFMMIEKNPLQKALVVYFEEEPPEELINDEFETFLTVV